MQTIRRSVRIPRLFYPYPRIFAPALIMAVNRSSTRWVSPFYWVDTLAEDRTCGLDSLPRLFGILPERFHTNLNYLSKVHRERI